MHQSSPPLASISQAAAQSGISAKMIRYYETIGLLHPTARTQANYRAYDQAAVRRLSFIARARTLGFSLAEIGRLLALWQNPNRSNLAVKDLALNHLAELDQRISALQIMRAAIQHAADRCPGDDQPDCPILDKLSGKATL